MAMEEEHGELSTASRSSGAHNRRIGGEPLPSIDKG